MLLDTLTIVGVGLIGGSIGLAARDRRIARRVVGVGRSRAKLERACVLGVLDDFNLDPVAAAGESNLTVFCTPVDQIADQVLAAAPCCRPGAILTDAGSTKATIVRRVEQKLPQGVAFIGSHPLAGSEKRGSENADRLLFQNRLTVLTRTEHTDTDALARTSAFWQALGSRVRVMSPEEHDRALALTSHLPHLLASALAGMLPLELRDLVATGFRDTTRIAAGDPALWTAIFTHNRGALLEALTHLEARLAEFRHALETEDGRALDDLLAQGKKVRDALGS